MLIGQSLLSLTIHLTLTLQLTNKYILSYQSLIVNFDKASSAHIDIDIDVDIDNPVEKKPARLATSVCINKSSPSNNIFDHATKTIHHC